MLFAYLLWICICAMYLYLCNVTFHESSLFPHHFLASRPFSLRFHFRIWCPGKWKRKRNGRTGMVQVQQPGSDVKEMFEEKKVKKWNCYNNTTLEQLAQKNKQTQELKAYVRVYPSPSMSLNVLVFSLCVCTLYSVQGHPLIIETRLIPQ